MNTPWITSDSHPKLNKFKWLEWKKIKITWITEGKKATEEWTFTWLYGRWILIKWKNECFVSQIAFIGYDSAIVLIEDEESNIIFNNATEDVIDFFQENLPTYFSWSDGEWIVEANNKRVNEILEWTFWNTYPKLEMVA